mgnify:CR=1 FL=1
MRHDRCTRVEGVRARTRVAALTLGPEALRAPRQPSCGEECR